MINIKKLHFFPIFMVFYSCMEPVDEGLWSIDQKELFDTQGFCRNVSVSGNAKVKCPRAIIIAPISTAF